MDFHTLFQKWKAQYPIRAFIRDGIVDAEHYELPHLLFVLRDMNCQAERDLCRDLRENGSGWKTWNNIGRWTKALLDGTAAYPRDMSKEKRIAQLKRIAVMNLKKEGGTSRAEGSSLLEAVQTQHTLLYEEIRLCSPSLIICCGLPASGMPGTAALLKEYVFPHATEWQTLPSQSLDRTWQYYFAEINGTQVPIISFCHPQVTVLAGNRGHERLFLPIYQDMLAIRKQLLKQTKRTPFVSK